MCFAAVLSSDARLQEVTHIRNAGGELPSLKPLWVREEDGKWSEKESEIETGRHFLDSLGLSLALRRNMLISTLNVGSHFHFHKQNSSASAMWLSRTKDHRLHQVSMDLSYITSSADNGRTDGWCNGPPVQLGRSQWPSTCEHFLSFSPSKLKRRRKSLLQFTGGLFLHQHAVVVAPVTKCGGVSCSLSDERLLLKHMCMRGFPIIAAVTTTNGRQGGAVLRRHG